MYYKSGNLYSRFNYRDDSYNTLESVRQYRSGVLDCEFTYDAREALVRQRWYNSKGKVYTLLDEPSDPPPSEDGRPSTVSSVNININQQEAINVQQEAYQQGAINDQREAVIGLETIDEDDEEDDPGSGLGNDIGGVRFKPREEDTESSSGRGSESGSDDNVSESTA
jgi:hypothetical protein